MVDERDALEDEDKKEQRFLKILLACLAAVALLGAFVLFYFYRPSRIPKEIMTGRAIAIARRLETKANLDKKVRIFAYEVAPSGIANSRLTSFRGELRIETGRLILERLSDQALESLLAHEIGHYLAGHFKTSEQTEAEADAWAIKLSGAESLAILLGAINDPHAARRIALAEREIFRENNAGKKK